MLNDNYSEVDQIIDILVIEDNENTINLFKVITKKFDLTIKFARSMTDFFEIITQYHFKFVLCGLYSENKKDALFIAQFFNRLRLSSKQGKLLLFTSSMILKREIDIHGFDGQLEKEFPYIYAFFKRHFNFRSISSVMNEENVELHFANA